MCAHRGSPGLGDYTGPSLSFLLEGALGEWVGECCILSLSPQPRTCCSQRQCTRAQEHGPDLESPALTASVGLPSWGASEGLVTQPLCPPPLSLCMGPTVAPGAVSGTQRGGGDVGRGWVMAGLPGAGL